MSTYGNKPGAIFQGEKNGALHLLEGTSIQNTVFMVRAQIAPGSGLIRGSSSRASSNLDDLSHPTNMGVVEAEPLSIHRIPNVGTVMTKVSHPHMGNHSKEFIMYFRLEGDRQSNGSTTTPPFCRHGLYSGTISPK